MRLRDPCPVCKGEKRHKRLPNGDICPHKRRSTPRGPKEPPEARIIRLRNEISMLPDGDFAAIARAIAKDAADRAKKIREEAEAEAKRVKAEAAERLKALAALTGDVDEDEPEEDEETPAPAPAAPAPKSATPFRGAPPGKICGALYPDNPLIKCRQPEGHEGQHHNADHHKSWPRRMVS